MRLADPLSAMSTGRLWLALMVAPCLPAAAQWKALGPYGGPAAIVQTDPNSARTIVAGTNNALLFRSNDGGDSWEALPFPLQLRAVLHALVIHPRIPNLYFAGISAERAGAAGMWRSADGGTTWQPVPAFDGLEVRSIAVFRGNALLMATGTDTGLFKTTDGGLTWTRISPADNRELQPVVSVAFDPKDPNVLYAGTPHLPWKTVDGGESWQSVYLGMIDDSDIFSVVVDRNRPQRVFTGACSGIYRSFDGGARWAKPSQSREASARTYILAQDPQYENVLFAGTTHGMIRSPDGGVTWKTIAPYTTRSIAFDLARLGRIFIATDQAGILRTDDNGETWQPANRGFCNRRLTPLAIDGAGAVYTSGSLDSMVSALFVLLGGGEEWSIRKMAAKPLMLTTSTKKPQTLYAATPAGLLISRNVGETWTTVKVPFDENRLTALLAPQWEFNAVLAATGSSVFVSRDSAKTWSHLRFPAPIRSLLAFDAPWIAALAESDLYVSMDGVVWKRYGRVDAGGEIYGIVSSAARIFVATTRGLRMSDQARLWGLVSGLPEGNTVQVICRHPWRDTVLFAASYNTIFTSADAGRSWTRMATRGWPVDSIRQMIVAPGNPDRLLVLTAQQGVFALPLAHEPKISNEGQESAEQR